MNVLTSDFLIIASSWLGDQNVRTLQIEIIFWFFYLISTWQNFPSSYKLVNIFKLLAIWIIANIFMYYQHLLRTCPTKLHKPFRYWYHKLLSIWITSVVHPQKKSPNQASNTRKNKFPSRKETSRERIEANKNCESLMIVCRGCDVGAAWSRGWDKKRRPKIAFERVL